MGASIEQQRTVAQGKSDRFRISVKVTPEEYQTLREIVHERSSFKNPYLCTIQRLLIDHSASRSVFCQNNKQIIIEYEPYDYLLIDAFKNKAFPQTQIEKIIFSVCSALLFLFNKKYRHGDIQPKLICSYRGEWKLMDNYFIKRGISAYEKVLEGDEGFISPNQMEKIRHGFVRQSPPIEESDEIFALGMTCLQLMTGKSSREYYKQSYIRFNEPQLAEAINFIHLYYPPYLAGMVQGMVNINENQRITIRQIISQPFINRHSKKYSLRPVNKA